jgi:hypothetical protein
MPASDPHTASRTLFFIHQVFTSLRERARHDLSETLTQLCPKWLMVLGIDCLPLAPTLVSLLAYEGSLVKPRNPVESASASVSVKV